MDGNFSGISVKGEKPMNIPATPNLKRLGYGTGVGVFHIDRSPKNGHLSSPWALKKIMRNLDNGVMGERLRNEADILRKINHENIIGFRAFTRTVDGRECLAMEECNTSLADLIEKYEEKGNNFPVNTITKVALDVAKALDYIHNVVYLLHGDIKSHNVLVKGNFDTIKLCDFGVSLPLTSEGILNKTVAGENAIYIGTELWTAPEVYVTGGTFVTSKADIFAYGLTLWEMLAKAIPHSDALFEASNTSFNEEEYDSKIVELIGTRPRIPACVCNKEYADIITLFRKCTKSDYKKRFSAKNVLEFCSVILSNLSSQL